jgi:hypothetical protein
MAQLGLERGIDSSSKTAQVPASVTQGMAVFPNGLVSRENLIYSFRVNTRLGNQRMKSKSRWKRLLDHLQIDGEITPVTDNHLDEFEATINIKLPLSYRDFCKVLGPGSLEARIRIEITAPGFGIETMNTMIWSNDLRDLERMCSKPELVKRALFFGSDISTNNYFFHKEDITDVASNELSVYVIYRDWEVCHLAHSFESFIYDCCLINGIPHCHPLDTDPPVFHAGE